MIKSIGKLVIVAGIAYLTIASEMNHIMGLWDMAPPQIGLYVLWVAFKLFLYILWMFLVLAILDFTYQKWKHMEELKMTKEEVKEEHKQTEGDPKVKAKIRSLQMEAARKRMMSKVPEADVVVTNPTHIAVALLYDSEKKRRADGGGQGQGPPGRKNQTNRRGERRPHHGGQTPGPCPLQSGGSGGKHSPGFVPGGGGDPGLRISVEREKGKCPKVQLVPFFSA